MSYKKIFFVLGLILTLFSITGSAWAQSDTQRIPTDDEVNAIAKNMFCPVCENTPLDVCPTQACAEWRELIREKLALGWTEEQIQQYFVDQFGDRVLASPPARGLNWLVYIIPPLTFVVGAFILYRSIRSMRKQVTQTEVKPVEDLQTDEYISRLEKELQNQ
ncbi:MAG TPA: cytochrome c-type biogenesis protein [Anaerolineales bacterium]|nr:cytochrome c-type biogenesis protein [Anaerolineales bacterium]